VEVSDAPEREKGTVCGLDLGIKKIFGLYINNGFDKVIGSKRHYRQWLHHTKRIADEKSRLAKHNRKTSKRLQRLYCKRSKWRNNLYNNMVAKLFRILNLNNVRKLVVGDVTHIRDDNDKGRRVNQMVHNYWSFDLLYKRIENKAEENGIEIERITEEYTSRTCPICGDRSKSNNKDRIFVCSYCGFINHRDIVGARNIYSKSMCGSKQSIHRGETAPLEAVT
jgi:putative transposase